MKTEIWDVLEQDDFAFKSLLVLENLQVLESYLWPGYTEDSSNFHVLLIVLMCNVRTREHLPTWGVFCLRWQFEEPLLTAVRYIRRQSSRVFEPIPTNSFYDFGYHALSDDSNALTFFHYQRLPVTRQRDHQEGMRSAGLYFDLAQYIERKEAGSEAGSEPAIEKGLESCSKAIRRR